MPIQGARVMAAPKGQTSKDALTDLSGQYTIENAGEGRVYISIFGKGYLRPQPRSVAVNLRPGETVRQDFELTPAPSISGAIVDADTGEPLAGCRVTALRKIVSEGEVLYARVYHAVDVDKSGEFRVEWVEPGEYSIEVAGVLTVLGSRRGRANEKRCRQLIYFPESREPEIRGTVTVSDAGNTNLTIRVKQPQLHSISGSISSPDGTAFRWFDITLSQIGRNGERFFVGSGQVERSFHLGELGAGDYYLTVTPPRTPGPIFAPMWNEATTPLPKEVLIHERLLPIRGDVSDLDVPLEVRFAVPVGGAVRMENGGPSPMVQMMLYRIYREGEVRSNLRDGPHEVLVHPGEYWPALRGLPQGYAVSEILAEGKKLVEPLRVEAAPRSLTFVVTSGLGTLSGTITGAKGASPVGGMLILFQEPIGERVNGVVLRISHPDQEGGFTLPGLAAGKYRAVVLTEEEGPLHRDSNYLRKRAVAAPEVEIRAGETTKVTLSR
ncbi:MAG: carboxypeptidase regulatory-like domain-containing protein [Acidobacteria bacterium]|nr:carboxypeptidase regulatory-like domain-containing protein [Acidobacteriota bacterium]